MTDITVHTMGNIERIAMKVPSLRPLVLLVQGVFKTRSVWSIDGLTIIR